MGGECSPEDSGTCGEGRKDVRNAIDVKEKALFPS